MPPSWNSIPLQLTTHTVTRYVFTTKYPLPSHLLQYYAGNHCIKCVSIILISHLFAPYKNEQTLNLSDWLPNMNSCFRFRRSRHGKISLCHPGHNLHYKGGASSSHKFSNSAALLICLWSGNFLVIYDGICSLVPWWSRHHSNVPSIVQKRHDTIIVKRNTNGAIFHRSRYFSASNKKNSRMSAWGHTPSGHAHSTFIWTDDRPLPTVLFRM